MEQLELRDGPKGGCRLLVEDPGSLIRVHLTSGMNAVLVGPGDDRPRGVASYYRTTDVTEDGATVFAYQAPTRHEQAPGGGA